ncbi:hypothetical protein JCGZ_10674 [Jatropha curcas]|uniref:Uncharacterized protein n=1 Tax=Jatropha curcas TaxID=180498 RepID=A0A067KS88_JATCU|nr:uncharacterized protein LOC105636675 [Jatropha curcas]KDP35140.1 hypothetical protein JCGZ_10674 [Jatropha curcas]
MEGEKNGGVDTKFLSLISLEGPVSVLRRRKKSSKLIVTEPDCEQDNTELPKEDGEIDFDEFLNSILQDQHGEKYNSESQKDGEIDLDSSVDEFFDSVSQEQHVENDVSEFDVSHSISQQTNLIFDLDVPNSKVPEFSHPIAPRRIRLKIELQRALSWPSSLQSEPNDPEAVRFLASTTAAGLPSHSHHVNLEWMFILTNLVLEILLMALDQIASPQKPECSLAALAVSVVAVVVSSIELYLKAMRQGVILKGEGLRFWLQYPSSSSDKPLYTFTDVFGFICALCQFTFSTIAYSYHKRHADNPINISIVSLIYIICLASSKLTNHETPMSIR